MVRMMCLNCGVDRVDDAEVCPHCGTPAWPADLDDEASVTITRTELQVLGFFATAYARQIGQPNVVETILRRLERQGVGDLKEPPTRPRRRGQRPSDDERPRR